MRDPVLTPLMEASDDDSRGQELERLMLQCAEPAVKSVIARFARSGRGLERDEVDDVVATVTLRLVRKLQTAGTEEIGDFENYVVTVTYHTIYDFMRRRFPEWTRLKNRIRYLLDRDPRFAFWSTPDGIACGLHSWRERTDLLRSLEIGREAATPVMLDESRPQQAVAALFDHAGGPILLDAVVRTLADLWRIREVRRMSSPSEALPDPAAQHETRQFLRVLWQEIKLLTLSHRTALLLNLRDADGVNAVALFVLARVATIEEIAGVLDMSVDELAEVWERLPIDDLEIAGRLGVNRQQVINLRRSARERLARRTLLMTTKYERRRG